MEVVPLLDAQRLYKQWQDGKLLDNDERQALHSAEPAETKAASFAELLKKAADAEG